MVFLAVYVSDEAEKMCQRRVHPADHLSARGRNVAKLARERLAGLETPTTSQ